MENRKYQETQAALHAEFRRELEGGELDKDQIDKMIEDYARNFVGRRTKRGVRFTRIKKRLAVC